MKNKYQWLLEVADRKPLLFSVLLLLIAVGVMAKELRLREQQYQACIKGQGEQLKYYEKKDEIRNQEVKEKLQEIAEIYRRQLEEQRKVNNTVTTTINENKKIINTKNLKQ